MNSLITIIIPCYNQAKYLNDSLNSALSQCYKNFECIIVNDGSRDETDKVARLWSKKDSRFTSITKENGGLSSARNAGLAIAKGDYIQFLDADDIIDKAKLELQISLLKKTSDYSLCYCDYFTCDEYDLNKEIPARYLSPEFITSDPFHELLLNWETKLSIPCHSFLFKASLFNATGIRFNESLPNHEDWECWMNIFALNPQIFYVNKKLATYRIRSKSMCENRDEMKQGYLKAIGIQKNKYKNDKITYGLLCEKENLVKYGFKSKSSLVAQVGGLKVKMTGTINKVGRLFTKV